LVTVGAAFIAVYANRGNTVPIGSDTPQVLWRANVVAARGLDGLPAPGPPVLDAGEDRPGLPLVMALISAASGLTPTKIAFGLPAGGAIALGLAAGAFGVGVLRRPAWTFGLFVLVAGISMNVQLMSAGYFDSLLATAAVLAALTALALATDRVSAAAAVCVLFAGAVLFHRDFAALAAVIAVAVAASMAVKPSAGVDRRNARWFALRLVTAVIVGMGAGMILLIASPVRLMPVIVPGRQELLEKLSRLLRPEPMAALILLMVVGLLALRSGRGSVGLGLRVLAVWTGSALAAVVLLLVGFDLHAHRAVSFAMAIPILAATGVVAAVQRARRRSSRSMHTRAGWWAAAAVAVVLAAIIVASAEASWLARPPYIKAERYASLGSIARTIDATPPGLPVVVVVDAPGLVTHGATPAIRRIRALVDPLRVADVHVFVGNVDDALAGRRTSRPEDPGFTADAATIWPTDAPVLHEDPLVLVSGLFVRGFAHVAATHPGISRAGQLLAFRGTAVARTVPSPHGVRLAVLATLAVILSSFVAGFGWSWSLLPGTVLVRAALAPAFGLGALAVAAFAADRLGVLAGAPGPGRACLAATAAAGWVPAVIKGVFTRPDGHGRSRRI